MTKSKNEIYISEVVCNRIRKRQTAGRGFLYGIQNIDSNLILGISFIDAEQDIHDDDILLMLPFAIKNVGTFVSRAEKKLEAQKTTGFCLIHNLETNDIALQNYNGKEFKPVEYKIVGSSFIKEKFLCFNITGILDLSFDYNEEGLTKGFDSVKTHIKHNPLQFYFGNSKQISTESEIKPTSNKTIKDICSSLEKSSVTTNDWFSQYSVSFIQLRSKEHDSKDELIATTVEFRQLKTRKISLSLSIDTLAFCEDSVKQKNFPEILQRSILRYLELVEQSLLLKVINKTFNNFTLKCHHFHPSELGHPVDILYDQNESENNSAGIRKSLHQRFGLSLDVPYFRKGNSIDSRQKIAGLYPVMNVHQGLNPSGVKGGKIAIVKGNYNYFHYTQAGMNDVGWGCAYRSLQTIFSWFLWKGYTDAQVPTHKEIQECLVKLKDKPKSFIGSRQWIGSSEIAFCLDDMLNVSAEILHVSSREELVSYGSKLEAHFSIYDTPVMIGGGQLAHTIIGTHFDKENGDIQFLVLDPHYTGKDDLKSIQTKGGIGWKSVHFFEKNTFFNLCLPKTPEIVF